MIRLRRLPEPPELRAAREKHLPRLREHVVEKGRELRAEEIKEFNLPAVRKALYEGQGKKCCYCEERADAAHFPVEHYRPKTRVSADGALPARGGYWWLAHTWENLLYACTRCNGKKSTKFPLRAGSTPLAAEEAPPGKEEPMLLDPYDTHPYQDPVLLIEFQPRDEAGVVRWRPFARRGDERAKRTIYELLELDSDGLLTSYQEHVNETVMPKVDLVKQALPGGERWNGTVRPLWNAFCRAVMGLLAPGCRLSALSYDALRHFVPDERLRPHLRRGWPLPPARL